jgi:DNA-binding NtrC family response regulator
MQVVTHEQTRVLVVDPMRENRAALAQSLSQSGMTCLEAADGMSAWTRFTTDNPDLVLAAFRLPGLPAIDLLNRVRDVSTTPFLIHVPAREFAAVLTAMRNGAADVIPYPFDLHELPTRLRAAIANHLLVDHREGDLHEFTGRSAAAVRIREQMKALAGLRISVLILGENGTGRDYAANSLAHLDRVAQGSLVKVTAATGGRRNQSDAGKTIYLDGIEHFSRVDQAYWYSRICDAEASFDHAPRRVIVSSGNDLRALARKGALDPGLADCLLRFVIAIPPLRDRSEDVEPLCDQLVRYFSRRIGRPGARLSKPALTLLEQQPWPGNTAQLAAIIEKLVAFSVDGVIGRGSVVSLLSEAPASVVSLRQDAVRRQRDELIELLDATGGNLAEAARRMNMSRGAVIYRAQKFGLLAKRVQPRS